MVITNVMEKKNNLSENQKILNSIFKTVDFIKGDFNTCTHFKNTCFSYEIKVSESIIELSYDPKTNIIKRKTDDLFVDIMSNVTDFYLKYFPENKSVLYRIEVGNKDLIRGYVFLRNLKEV